MAGVAQPVTIAGGCRNIVMASCIGLDSSNNPGCPRVGGSEVFMETSGIVRSDGSGIFLELLEDIVENMLGILLLFHVSAGREDMVGRPTSVSGH